MSTLGHYLTDMEGLGDRFEPDAREAPAGTMAWHRPRMAASPDDLMREGVRESVPSLAMLATICLRGLRTKLPIVVADALALAITAMVAEGVLSYGYPANWATVGSRAAMTLLPLLLAYWLTDLYSEIWVHPVAELRQLTRVTSVVLLAVAGGGLALWPLPLWCAVAWPIAVALVPVFRTIAHRCCESRQWWGYPTLVIGSGDRAGHAARVLMKVPRSGLRPVLLTDPRGRCRDSILPVVNDRDRLEQLVREAVIRHAVVSLPDLSSAALTAILSRYAELVPHLLVLSDDATLPTLWGASRDFGRLSGVEMRNGLLLATMQLVKRGIDLAVAGAALLVGLPVFLGVALLVKLTSRGPVLYCQTRIGRYCRPFRAWKFRTMHPNGDAMLAEYLARYPAFRAEWERDHKLRNDPRVTWVGRFLRRTSLDELPQFWNVLCGEMSVVGPRPIVMDEVARYGEVFRLYASVKPGITGLWQTSGRNDVTYGERVLLDEFYVRHWSPWLDVYIIAKTVVVMLNHEGAY